MAKLLFRFCCNFSVGSLKSDNFFLQLIWIKFFRSESDYRPFIQKGNFDAVAKNIRLDDVVSGRKNQTKGDDL